MTMTLLDQSLSIPVLDGLQAQGDLIVIPYAVVASSVKRWSDWVPVPPQGVELLRGGAGGNAHTLVAEPGTCLWTNRVTDFDMLAIGMFRASAVVYLLHPEHGASGCAPGTYVVRRQREHEGRRSRLVCD
ncbi:hypothetical protein [Nonomuraea sp. SYSU D8015]|uniref:hypothetical protein n=1 Tax=Nonomuraea sp. SYSU D8015 TaxID=2593644 RepID=UPI00166152F3|nr:hypothetical protein [Nonomuraea sp. SYSU D8015]